MTPSLRSVVTLSTSPDYENLRSCSCSGFLRPPLPWPSWSCTPPHLLHSTAFHCAFLHFYNSNSRPGFVARHSCDTSLQFIVRSDRQPLHRRQSVCSDPPLRWCNPRSWNCCGCSLLRSVSPLHTQPKTPVSLRGVFVACRMKNALALWHTPLFPSSLRCMFSPKKSNNKNLTTNISLQKSNNINLTTSSMDVVKQDASGGRAAVAVLTTSTQNFLDQ